MNAASASAAKEPNPGDELRDLAARLLSYQFGTPKTEQRTDGKKVDVYFEYSELGKLRRLYVEAKDYQRNLVRRDCVNIYADYSGIIERNKPSTLLIVTRNGLSADADQYVNTERHDLAHQTIWDLEKSVLGLDEYVRSLTGVFSAEGLDRYYVESRAHAVEYVGAERITSGVRDQIFDRIQAWSHEPNSRPIAVLGGYGAGKSSLSKRLVSHFAAAALASADARIPILIKLGQFSRAANLESLLSAMFMNEFPVRNFNVPLFLDSSKRGRFLIVCDGFDEMKHAMSWSEFRSTIAEINRLNTGQSKLLLLGRPNAFLTKDEHFQVLRGRRRFGEDYRKITDWPEFEEWELSDFDAADRSEFIAKYLLFLSHKGDAEVLGPKQIEQRIAKVEELASSEPEIFAKPVHAQILTELASEPTFDIDAFDRGLSRWALYEAFFAFLAEREAQKEARRPISDERRLRFLSELAFWLWSERGGATSFSVAEIPKNIYDLMELEDHDDPELKAREYLTGAFLEKKLGDVFYFGHRSFAEFLVARRLLSVAPHGHWHGVYADLLHGSVLDFFEEGLGRRGLKNWAETFEGKIGTFDFNYCRLIAKHCGNFREMKRLLPVGSFAQKILSCFDDSFQFGPVTEKRLIKMAGKVEANLFYQILAVIDVSFSKRRLMDEGVDRVNLTSFCRLIVDNPVYSKKKFKTERSGERFIIDGVGLREVVEKELSAAEMTVKEEKGVIRSTGWPEKIVVSRDDLYSSYGPIGKGFFRLFNGSRQTH
jgi:hypothetical protein